MVKATVTFALGIIVMHAALAEIANSPDKARDPSPETSLRFERFQSMQAGVDAAESSYLAADFAGQRAKADQLWEAYVRTNDLTVPLLLPLLREYPLTTAAFNTAEWIVTNRRSRIKMLLPYAAEALELLQKHHTGNPKLGRVCADLGTRSPPNEVLVTEFLEAVLKNNPDRSTRGQATLSLARLAKAKVDFGNVDSKAAASARARQLYEVVLRDYADCVYTSPRSGDKTKRLDQLAERELFELVSLAVGQPAPEIDGEDLQRQKFKLSHYRGKVVVLTCWATWCGPCMQMIPHERNLVERMKGRPFALIGINGDDDLKEARAAVKRENISWRSFWDRGPKGAISTAWNVRHWPTTYVIDQHGVIRFKEVYGKQLDQAVDGLLNEK